MGPGDDPRDEAGTDAAGGPDDTTGGGDAPSGDRGTGPIFVVGNSRSGTTLLGSVIGRHPEVHMFRELHFFEQLWSPDGDRSREPPERLTQVAARLLCIEREGYLGHGDPEKYEREAEALVADLGERPSSREVYAAFLESETRRNGASRACEQTPRNVFYLAEILDWFEDARVVHMVRDPRDVLLSQKKKWRQRFMGAENIPLREAVRSWVNYHPLTIARLWQSSMDAAGPFEGGAAVATIRFEDLVRHPEPTVEKVCRHVGVDYSPDLLAVSRDLVISSHRGRREERGIDSGAAGRWREGDLTDTEIYICERTVGEEMERRGYTLSGRRPGWMSLIRWTLTLPLHLLSAVVFNLSRAKSMKDAIRRRLASARSERKGR